MVNDKGEQRTRKGESTGTNSEVVDATEGGDYVVRENLDDEIEFLKKDELEMPIQMDELRGELDRKYVKGKIDKEGRRRGLNVVKKAELPRILILEDKKEVDEAERIYRELDLKLKSVIEKGKALFKELGVSGYLKALFYIDREGREKLKALDEESGEVKKELDEARKNWMSKSKAFLKRHKK